MPTGDSMSLLSRQVFTAKPNPWRPRESGGSEEESVFFNLWQRVFSIKVGLLCCYIHILSPQLMSNHCFSHLGADGFFGCVQKGVHIPGCSCERETVFLSFLALTAERYESTVICPGYKGTDNFWAIFSRPRPLQGEWGKTAQSHWKLPKRGPRVQGPTSQGPSVPCRLHVGLAPAALPHRLRTFREGKGGGGEPYAESRFK